jgi:ATP-dependent helicase/nuclease subunit B
MPVILQHGPGPLPWSFDNAVVVVPTKRRIRHLTRDIFRLTRQEALPSLPFHTLESLGRSLFVASGLSRQIVQGPVQTLLYHTAIRTLSASLRYFKVKKGEPRLYRGTFDKVIGVISHLKESGVTPALLEEECEAAPLDERQKLRDVASIYSAYEQALERLHATDAPGMYRVLWLDAPPADFASAFRRVYPGVASLLLAGFDEFSLPEIGFIQRLCALPGLSVSLLFDFLPGNTGLFGHLEENYRKFREMDFRPVRELPDSATQVFLIGSATRVGMENAVGSHVARSLFNAGATPVRMDLRQSVTLVRATSRVNEIETVCRLIVTLVRERPDRDLAAICVAMHRPQSYTDIVREQFARFRIPVNITDRFDLSRSPLVTDILGLLQTALHGFRRDDVLRIARSPFFRFDGPEGAIDAANLTDVSRALRITAGRKAWREKIARAGERLRAARRTVPEKALNALERAARDIEWLGDLLGPTTVLMTPGDYGKHVRRLLDVCQVTGQILLPAGRVPQDLLEKDCRAYARFLGVVDETVAILEFQEGPDAMVPPATILDHLRVAISQERYNVREQFGRGVLVTSIEETRGLPIEVMIVCGLVDGEFPSVYEPEVFLSPTRRKAREQHAVWENRYLFYQAVTNWSEHLYLTYPVRDDELDLVRSSFIDAVVKIADVEETDEGIVPSAGAVLVTDDDLLRWCGREIARTGKMPAIDIPPLLLPSLDEVHRAARVSRSREVDHSLPDYEGRLSGHLSPAAADRLAHLRDDVFSVSQLESYGDCPFQFFSSRLLRLAPREEMEEALTPLERGSVLHDVLFEFYLRRRERGLPPLHQCSEAEAAVAEGEILALADETIGALDLPDPLWTVDRDAVHGRLREFVAAERSRSDAALPSFFEVAFGGPDQRAPADPLITHEDPVILGAVRLRGRVDRIDIGPDFFTLIDYKTGSRVPSLADLRAGRSLQLPLYLPAVAQILEGATGRYRAPAAAMYYLLRGPVMMRPGVATASGNSVAFTTSPGSRQFLPSDEDVRSLVEDAIARASGYLDRMAAGEYPLTDPGNISRVCAYCAFTTICRIQTLRHVQPSVQEDA